MPFKSKAQLRKFFRLAKQGKISDETLQEWIAATPNIVILPERVGRRKSKKRKK